MPIGLERFHQAGDTHFVTFSCFRRQPLLGTPKLRDLFVETLTHSVERYEVILEGWVVMPEHVHLLINPYEGKAISTVVQVVKQRYSRTLKTANPGLCRKIEIKTGCPSPMPVWETRFYDHNVRDEDTFYEKLTYIHNNPLKRGLVKRPEEWKWSSYSRYLAASQRRYAPHPTLPQ